MKNDTEKAPRRRRGRWYRMIAVGYRRMVSEFERTERRWQHFDNVIRQSR